MMKKSQCCLLVAIICACLSVAAAEVSEQELTVVNPSDHAVLAGTLAIPQGEAPRAAIVMATGSGAQNRDEELLGHRPFKLISDRLAAQGFAVLRMDDRGVGGSSNPTPDATTLTFAGDIACAVEQLDSLFPEVPIGIIGHSEGGVIAMINAADNPRCDFIITLAGPAWTGDSIIMSQTRAIAQAAMGRWNPDQEAMQRRLLDIARSNMPSSVARIQMSTVLFEAYGAAASTPQMQASIDAMTSNWYRTFLRLDPAEYIRSIHIPWLALNGSKDLQVLPANLETINRLCPTADTQLIDGHNHLFQPAITGMVNEYQRPEQAPSDTTIDIILNWLNALVH